MKTRAQVVRLKAEYIRAHHHNLCDTEGFEEYREELKTFQERPIEELKREAEEYLKLNTLTMLTEFAEVQERQGKAIKCLINGDTQGANDALNMSLDY